MKKSKVSLGLRKFSANDKVELARAIVLAMTGNSNFTTPVPALSVVATAATALDIALQNAQDRGKTKVALAHAAEADLDNLLTQLALYVESASNNDPAKILSSGMRVKNDRTPSHVPGAPVNLSTAFVANDGEVKLNWDKVPLAKVYVVEQTDDPVIMDSSRSVGGGNPTPATPWKMVVIVTRTRVTITGLCSGSKYAFRIFAIGAGGYGAYSDLLIAKAK
jgi:hypothetical protein